MGRLWSIRNAIVVLCAFVGLSALTDAASAVPKEITNRSGCALTVSQCAPILKNPVMYDTAINGPTTMYQWAIERVTTRLQRWLPAYAAQISSCEKPERTVRPIIRNVEVASGFYHVLAEPGASSGSVCYLRRTKRKVK